MREKERETDYNLSTPYPPQIQRQQWQSHFDKVPAAAAAKCWRLQLSIDNIGKNKQQRHQCWQQVQQQQQNDSSNNDNNNNNNNSKSHIATATQSSIELRPRELRTKAAAYLIKDAPLSGSSLQLINAQWSSFSKRIVISGGICIPTNHCF